MWALPCLQAGCSLWQPFTAQTCKNLQFGLLQSSLLYRLHSCLPLSSVTQFSGQSSGLEGWVAEGLPEGFPPRPLPFLRGLPVCCSLAALVALTLGPLAFERSCWLSGLLRARAGLKPEMTLQQGAVTAAWLTRVQKPFRNAWALCGAAHLHNLKAFDKKVGELCFSTSTKTLASAAPTCRNSWQQIARSGT